MGNNIFLALRPEIFGKKDEHITLAYWTANQWRDALGGIWTLARLADRYLPTEIEINGYANWRGFADFGNKFYAVALVDRFKNPPLWELFGDTNPHITLQSSSTPIPNPVFYGNEFEPYIAEYLYFGRKGENGFDWFRFDDPDAYQEFRGWASRAVQVGQ